METFRVIYARFFVDFQAPSADVSNRVCLITGANTGVGFEAAKHLAKRNASTIIFGVRSISRGQAAAERIYQECPAYRGRVEVWELDMARFESVLAFGKRCEELSRLDIAILNAGIFSAKYAKTSDGWQDALQVNVLSTALLGMILLPILSRSAREMQPRAGGLVKPHLCIVSSDVQYMAQFKCRSTSGPLLKALNDPHNFSGLENYNITKLLEMYLVREMAALPIASGVVVNAANPGLTTSGLRRDQPGWFQMVARFFTWPTEKGSRNYIYAVLTDTPPGALVNHCALRAPASLVTSPEGHQIQKKFWGEVEGLCESLLSK